MKELIKVLSIGLGALKEWRIIGLLRLYRGECIGSGLGKGGLIQLMTV